MLFEELLKEERKSGKEEGREEGRQEGRNKMAEVIVTFLSEYGKVPDALSEKINESR